MHQQLQKSAIQNPAERSPLSLDELGNEIAELSAHIQAATFRLLTLIREFDERGGLGPPVFALVPTG